MKTNKNRERSRDKEINKEKNNTKKNKKDKSKKNNKDKDIEDNIKDQDKDKDNDNANSSNQNETQAININHHWKKYFDSHYNQIFYNNPFTGESVWELPEGAKVEESPGPIEIITSVPQEDQSNQKNKKEKKNKKNKDDNNEEEEDSVTEENKEINKNVNSYKEIEAIEEEELKERLRYRKMKNLQLKEWLKRPARQQVEESKREIAYTEGHYDYNIWYDKYLSDRTEDKEKLAAETKCNPTLDTGYTRADKQAKKNNSYFCLYFARGCCCEGVNCRYYHHVPTFEEVQFIENSKDVFGRSRFHTQLKDNGGIGIFTKNCRTLYVSDIKKLEQKDQNREMVKLIYENFSKFGEIEDIQYLPLKASCYIKFTHRCFAEYAKEAMMKQSMVGEEILSIVWAYNYKELDPIEQKIIEKEEENMFVNAILKNNKINEDNDEITQHCVQLQKILHSIDNNNNNNE